MAIVQTDPNRPNEQVVIKEGDPAVLQVLPFELPNGAMVQAQEFDLTEHQGKPWRLYAEADGSLSVALDGVHYWLVAETVLPERQFESLDGGEGNGDGDAQHVELPLDLNDVDVLVYPWPEDEQEVA